MGPPWGAYCQITLTSCFFNFSVCSVWWTKLVSFLLHVKYTQRRIVSYRIVSFACLFVLCVLLTVACRVHCYYTSINLLSYLHLYLRHFFLVRLYAVVPWRWVRALELVVPLRPNTLWEFLSTRGWPSCQSVTRERGLLDDRRVYIYTCIYMNFIYTLQNNSCADLHAWWSCVVWFVWNV